MRPFPLPLLKAFWPLTIETLWPWQLRCRPAWNSKYSDFTCGRCSRLVCSGGSSPCLSDLCWQLTKQHTRRYGWGTGRWPAASQLTAHPRHVREGHWKQTSTFWSIHCSKYRVKVWHIWYRWHGQVFSSPLSFLLQAKLICKLLQSWSLPVICR